MLADHLLIDLDGTLVDSRQAIAEAWSNWARQYGISDDAVRAALGGTSSDTLAKLVTATQLSEALSLITKLELETSIDVKASPGASEFISSIPPNKWSLVTSSRMTVARARMARAGLPLPRIVVCSDDYSRGKPDPEPYLVAIKRVGLRSTDLLAIEDSTIGITSAKSAQLRVIATAACSDSRDLEQASSIVSDLSKVFVSTVNATLLIRTEELQWH